MVLVEAKDTREKVDIVQLDNIAELARQEEKLSKRRVI